MVDTKFQIEAEGEGEGEGELQPVLRPAPTPLMKAPSS